MFHPIFSVLLRRPELVADHLSSYAGLAREEAMEVGTELVKRAIAGVVAAVCLLVFLILAGVAAMLWAMVAFHWSLVIVPAIFLVVGIVAGMEAKKSLSKRAFTELRSQLSADAETLHALGAQS